MPKKTTRSHVFHTLPVGLPWKHDSSFAVAAYRRLHRGLCVWRSEGSVSCKNKWFPRLFAQYALHLFLH